MRKQTQSALAVWLLRKYVHDQAHSVFGALSNHVTQNKRQNLRRHD
ncbi:MAG: hypothetical protein WCY93_03395 [Anaerolineaceae bacterium]